LFINALGVDGSVTYGRVMAGVREFMRLEAAGALCLLGAAVLALMVSNSPLVTTYNEFIAIPVEVRVGDLHIAKPLLLWINDGLMAVFFLLVGLEIKRELVEGELSTRSRAMLPAIAAIGGMAVPALIYALLNRSDPMALRGWAIPAATDIAFAIGAMSLLGRRVPVALKVFLLAIAIFDDLGAIVIIALFYTADLSLMSLFLSSIILIAMFSLNRFGVYRLAPYVLLAIALWVCVLKSGVHATLAGVAAAMAIPLRGANDESPLKELEHALLPWVAFLVVPLFGFANAGVTLTNINAAMLGSGVTQGIVAGLFIGKPLGVFGATYAAIRLGLADKPEGCSWLSLFAAACLAGIGFTMSLFIGTLAWSENDYSAPLRVGVLTGSLLSGLAGCLLLLIATRSRRRQA
jgi:NhaA family Na+:H+ antiporter